MVIMCNSVLHKVHSIFKESYSDSDEDSDDDFETQRQKNINEVEQLKRDSGLVNCYFYLTLTVG